MNRFFEHLNAAPAFLKAGVDVGAIGIAGTAFFTDIMPAIAVTLSVVWLALQIVTWVVNKRWRKK